MVVKNNNKTYYNINNINDFQDCLLDETKNNYNLENNYILRANLNWNDIKQELRNPIKLFSGEFDGNNFQISNFQMTNYQRNGLFSTTSKATIKNLILNINGKITGLDYVSALVGYANETEISNCKITGVVNVFSKGLYVGLYCGFSNSCTFTDNTIHLDNSVIRGNNSVGSFCGGILNSKVTKCIVTGTISILGINSENNDEPPKIIGGLVGDTDNSEFYDSKVDYVGSVTGVRFVGGFVGVDYNSKFQLCNMELVGSVNGIEYINLFCGYTKDIAQFSSVFYKCKIDNKSKINDKLVDIRNIDDYAKIANTSYFLTFKDSTYPESYYEILKIKNDFFKQNNIIYQIFDYLLTFTQLKNMTIKNLTIDSENNIALEIKNDFTRRWLNLSPYKKIMYEKIGFNRDSFDAIKFPDNTWSEFSNEQKICAFKLNFNQNIWDNKIVKKISKKGLETGKYDPNKKSKRQIITFSVNIKGLTLRFPEYIKNIILIEIKDYIADKLVEVTKMKKIKTNLKIFYTDLNLLEIMVIVDHSNYTIPDVDDVDLIPEPIQQPSEVISVDKPIDKVFINESSTKNDIINYATLLSNKDFGNLVRTSASKNSTIIANVKINNIECIDNDILLIYVNTELRGMQNIKVDKNSKAMINTIIYTENKFEVIQFKIYQHITKLFYNLPDQQIILEPGKKLGTFDNPILINAINKIPPIISPVSSENFGKPVQYSRTLISLYSKVLLNYKYADKGDILAIYVGTELRGKIEVQKKNKMSIASGMIYSSGVKEKITFRLYNKKLNAVVLVPELFFEVTAGSSVGSFNNPVTIRAIGKLPYTIKDIFNYYLPNTSIVVEPTSKEIGVNTNITYVDNSGNNVCSGCDTNNLCLFCSTCKTCESTQICYNCKTSSSCASCNLCNYCNTCNTCGESNICTNCNKCKSCGNCDCSSNSSTNNTNTSNPITTSNPTNTTSVVVNVDLSGLSVDSSGGGSGSGSGSGSGVPQKAPVLASVTPIGTTLDRTPSFTFSSDESGTIASSLSFGSVNRAIVGNNVITFSRLNLGNYTDATLSVTDSDGNVATLAIPSFSIVAEPQDLRAPILTSVTPIGETTNKSPSFVFTSDEAGTITSDLSFFTTNQAIIGENTITFTNLSPNVYTGRTVSVTDASGNKGSLIIPAFSIEFVDDVGPTLTLLSGIGDTKDTTPSITFLSDDTGTLTSNLDFTSSNIVEVGTNIVNFSELTEGTYTNKSISVTDASGNISTLAIPVFRIDTSGPVLQVVVPIGTTSDRTPTFIFSSSEPGIISSNTNFTSTISAVSGNNSITFTQLEFGTYTGVNVKVTDAGGSFTTLSVPSFTITGNDFVIESAQQIAFLDFYNRLKLRSFQKTKPTSVVGTGRGVSGLGNSLGNVSAF